LAFQRKQKGWIILTAAGIILVLLVSFGKYFPLHRWLCLWIPGLSLFRSPFRLIFIYAIFAGPLVGLGFEFLLDQKNISKSLRAPILLWGAAYTFLVLLAAMAGPKQAWVQVIFLLVGYAGLYFWFQKKNPDNWGKRILTTSILLSLLVSGWLFCPSRLGPASNFDYKKKSSLLSRIGERIGLSRVFIGDKIPYPIESIHGVVPGDYPTNASCLLGLRNVGGNNPLSLMKRGQLHGLPFDSFIHLMAVRGFVTGNEKGEVPGFNRYISGPVKFYEAKERMKFVYTPAKIEVVSDDGDRLKAMGQKDFNPYAIAYLDRNPPPEVLRQSQGHGTTLDYHLLRDELNNQAFEIKLDSNSLVVFAEVNYPGWKAWVDAKPAEIVTSNYLFRGLFVHSGIHQVTFRFEPAWYPLLFFAMGLWLLVTLFFWGRKGGKFQTA
jgi:hypothetical protein